MAFKDKRVKEIMLLWAEDEDMWLRRVAINHQLGKKEKTDSVLLEKILVKNLNSSEFLLIKRSDGVCEIIRKPILHGYVIF